MPKYPWREKTPSAKLCRLADKHGLPVRQLIEKHRKKLKAKKIDTTETTIRKAEALDRQWLLHLKNRVWNLQGSWNGEKTMHREAKRQKPKMSKTLEALTKGVPVSNYTTE